MSSRVADPKTVGSLEAQPALSHFHRSSRVQAPADQQGTAAPFATPWPWQWPPPGSLLPPPAGAAYPLRDLHSRRLSPSTCNGGRRFLVLIPVPSPRGLASLSPPRSSTSPEVPCLEYPASLISSLPFLYCYDDENLVTVNFCHEEEYSSS